MLFSVYNLFFYKPLLNALVWLVSFLPSHDVGIAVVILTLVVRFIIFPFTHKAFITQARIKKLEPELKKIKEKHDKDRQEQSKQIMELYKKHGISPFSGFVTLLVQIPIIIALYKVFLVGASFDASQMYSFVSIPGNIGMSFLGMIDMAKTSTILAVLAAISHFFQVVVSMPPVKKKKPKDRALKDEFARSMNLQFRYVMPIVIFFIARRFSSAIALYWTTNNLFAIVHGIYVKKKVGEIGGNQENQQKDGEANKNN